MARPGPLGGQYQPLTEDQIKQNGTVHCARQWPRCTDGHETCSTHGGAEKAFEHCTEVWYNVGRKVSSQYSGAAPVLTDF